MARNLIWCLSNVCKNAATLSENNLNSLVIIIDEMCKSLDDETILDTLLTLYHLSSRNSQENKIQQSKLNLYVNYRKFSEIMSFI